jgi:hypothetical protein
VPQTRRGRFQTGIVAEMKPEQDDRLGDVSQPTQHSLERLQPPEIIGQVENPALETVRRFWWRALDRVCCCFVLIRLSIHDRIFGPEPPTPADLKRDAHHERLVRAFPVASETIEPTKYPYRQNRDGKLGSHYRQRRSATILCGSGHRPIRPPGFFLNLVPCREVRTEELRRRFLTPRSTDIDLARHEFVDRILPYRFGAPFRRIWFVFAGGETP